MLATQTELAEFLGRSLTQEEASRADARLRQASSLVRGHLGCGDFTEPPPRDVVDVVCGMVERLFDQGGRQGVQQVSVDDGSVMFTKDASSGSPWLSASDKTMLRPYRCGGFTAVQFGSSRGTR